MEFQDLQWSANNRSAANGSPHTLKPGVVKSWLADFENDDLASRADRLAAFLNDLSDSSAPASHRLEAMDSCRGFASRLIDDLDRRRIGLSLPIPRDKARLSRKCTDTYRLLATRYREIASVLASSGAETGDAGNLARSCFQGIACLGEYLVVNCESYQRVEPGVWLEIHKLYEMAAVEGVEHTSLNGRSPAPRTVEHAYKRVLLLGLSGVFQHPFRDLSQLYARLDDWAALACLTTEPVDARRCLFLVDPSLDRPAIPMLPRSSLRPELNEKWLSTLELVNRLKRQYDKAVDQSIRGSNGSGGAEDLHSVEFLRRLILLLGIHPMRGARRQKTFKECELVVGLRSLSTALNDFQPVMNDEPASGTSVVSMVKGTFGHQRMKVASRSNVVLAGWEIEDESQSGMRLACKEATDASISIGDLVGIRTCSSPDWVVGTVNWATCSDTGELSLGIRKICTDARPVLASRMETDRSLDRARSPGLLLDGESRGGRTRSLICHRDLYLPGGTYLVSRPQGNGEMILQATNMLLTTRSFVWYEVVKPQPTSSKATLDLICPH